MRALIPCFDLNLSLRGSVERTSSTWARSDEDRLARPRPVSRTQNWIRGNQICVWIYVCVTRRSLEAYDPSLVDSHIFRS